MFVEIYKPVFVDYPIVKLDYDQIVRVDRVVNVNTIQQISLTPTVFGGNNFYLVVLSKDAAEFLPHDQLYIAESDWTRLLH